ncbi:MAG: hypothetical protein K5664_06305 [Firmicutes bacterium]|nr:hypothetical protein [Bacillota bacterium]
MSEKQARQKRKSEPQTEIKKKKSAWVSNTVITVIVIAFLGLAGYALKDNIKSILPERPEKEQTVSDLAKARDMSVDEFLAEYGLDGGEVTEKTTESEIMSKLTVANYAKYNDQTTEELLEQYGIESADENMLWQEAYGLMPMSKYAETMGMTFDDLKSQAGMPEEITEKTTLKEAEEIMSQQTEEETAEETAE